MNPPMPVPECAVRSMLRLAAWSWCWLAIAWVAGCSSSVVPGSRDASSDALACSMPGGWTCAAGSTCTAPDGCNECACSVDGRLACTLRACSAVDGGTRPCHATTDCGATERCVFASGCVPAGTCVPDDHCESLPTVGTFCGCDGRSFDIPSACPPDHPFASVGPCPSSDGGVVCHLDDGGVCGVGSTCGMGPGVCDFWVCQPDGTLALQSPCNPEPACRTSADCTGGQICVFTAGCGREGTTGVCTEPSDCGWTQTLCGCDGVTFTATCQPERAFSHTGACGDVDAG